MNNPIISVIVPIYKTEKYLERCINSILKQSFQNIEIILVDDGSPDASGAICDRYGAKYKNVRTIHQVNSGVSAARNAGIDQAIGEWLCFIDSDDYIENDYLENFHVNSEENDLYVQGYKIYLGEEYTEFDIPNEVISNKKELLFLLERNNILNSPCYKLYRSSIVKENNIRFDTSMSYGEDHYFTLHYLQSVNNIKYSNGCKYIYYHNTGESLSRRIVKPVDLVNYVNVIAPQLQELANKNQFTTEQEALIINQRVHFNLLNATINYTKTGYDKDVLLSIKDSLQKNIKGRYGLSKGQQTFVWVMMHVNIKIVELLLKVNERYRITEKLQLGF